MKELHRSPVLGSLSTSAGFFLLLLFAANQLAPPQHSLLICENDIVRHLMSVVPSVQLLVQRAVRQLRGVRVHVDKGQARHGVRQRVRVEGIRHVSVVTLHAVDCVQHAADQEAVPVEAAAEPGAEALDGLQVPRADLDEEDHLLVEALGVQGRVEHPQARLIHGKLHLERDVRAFLFDRSPSQPLPKPQQEKCSGKMLCLFVFSLR